MERFFDLFPDRQLASDLFAVVEDARIDVLISKEYGGIRRAYGERQERELEKRAPAEQLPLRQAFVENLVRASLGGLDRIIWPEQLHAADRGGRRRRRRRCSSRRRSSRTPPRRRCGCTRSRSASPTSCPEN